MAFLLRVRRIENEWALLSDVERSRRSLLELSGRSAGPDGDSFEIALHGTCGILGTGGQKEIVSSHRVEIRFPRFFPSMPIEARLERPVFHPNVDPANGFVCLWGRFAVEDTALVALRQLQRVISWELVNRDPRHVIQPAAIEWQGCASREWTLPLDYIPISETGFSSAANGLPHARRRCRLFSVNSA